MQKKYALILIVFLFIGSPAMAHFGMVIPSENNVGQQKKSVELTLSFSHPFESIGMNMEKPAAFYVVMNGGKTDLLGSLKAAMVMDHQAWQAIYRTQRPGVYHFVMEPVPYWEPSEDIFIIHYTKTVVGAFGADAGWDEPVGLPVEIVPMLRPFGNYAGNSFTGMVMMNGECVPFAEVEVEFYNRDGLQAPSDFHITQVIKADKNGVFSFACPKAGWWGFAALHEADFTLKTGGEEKKVEIGGVLWIYMDAWQGR